MFTPKQLVHGCSSPKCGIPGNPTHSFSSSQSFFTSPAMGLQVKSVGLGLVNHFWLVVDLPL